MYNNDVGKGDGFGFINTNDMYNNEVGKGEYGFVKPVK
jgi:hypothetical protein